MLGFRYDFHFFGGFDCNGAHFGVVLGVQVAVVLRDVDVYFASGFEVCGRQLLGFVVAFCAPGYVVGIAEGVDIENIDVGGG